MSRDKTPQPSGAALLLLLAMVGLHGIGTMSGPSSRPPFPETEKIFVECTGIVSNPGVYEFSRNPNLDQLTTETKYDTRFHLDTLPPDARFSSGSQVRIQYDGVRTHIRVGQMTAFYKMTLKIPLSLNHESAQGLSALPGIGLRLANAIVAERTARNGFSIVEELLSVPGVTQRLYRKIRPYLKP
jgi:competence protein ComEA